MSTHQSKSDRPEPRGPTMEERTEQLNQLWASHNSWGTPDDYAVKSDQLELDGFKIMDTVRVFEDCTSDDGTDLEAGDEGTVVGVWFLRAGLFHSSDRHGLLVYLPDTGLSEPVGLATDQVEHE